MSQDKMLTLINSLLPIIATLFLAWLNSRTEQTKHRSRMEEAKHRIELIKEYVISQELAIDDPTELGEIKKAAAKELYDIKAFLDLKLQSLEKTSEKSDSFLQRFFLLYKMKTGLAAFLRVAFFIVLFVSILWSILVSSLIFNPLSSLGSTSTDALTNFLATIMLTLPVILVALLLRWLAVRFDTLHKKTM